MTTVYLSVAWLLVNGITCSSATSTLQLSPTFFSINMKTLVKWTPVTDSAIYSTEIKGKTWLSWKENAACMDSRAHECDVTSLCTDVHLQYTARVRVKKKDKIYSNWEYTTMEFIPSKNTILGAPTLKLQEVNSTLWVHVKTPQTQQELPNKQPASLSDLLPDITYEIKYWKDGSSGKKFFYSRKQFFELPGVDPTSPYCATSRIILGKEKRNGVESDTVCFTSSSRDKGNEMADLPSKRLRTTSPSPTLSNNTEKCIICQKTDLEHETTNTENDKFSTWIYILGSVAVAAVVILIVACYCCCKSSDKKTEQPENLQLKDARLDY